MSNKKALKNKSSSQKGAKKKQVPDTKTKSDNYKLWLGLTIILTFFVYYSTIKYGFVNLDDDRYILQNESIKDISAKNFITWFTSYYDGHYHPLSQLSLSVDYKIASLSLPANFQIHELKANVFHFVNIILHLLNVLFVFILLKRLFGRNEVAIVAALLFGLHPINVESVAWVSERKNLLFTLFFLTSLFNYVKFLQKNHRKYYLYSLILFLLAAFSKVTAVSLFFCLFLIEYFLDKKVFNLKAVLLKLPYFIIAVAFIIIASLAQSSTWGEDEQLSYTFIDKIFLASFGFIQYIIKILVPFNLSAYYPYPIDIGKDISLIQYVSPVLVIGVLILIIVLIKKGQKEFAFGLAFFILNIALLVKLFDVPRGNYLMAERYAYIPSIGIFIMIGWTFVHFCKKFEKRKITYIVILVIYIGILSISTIVRIKIWKDSSALWTDVIDNYPNFALSYNMRGMDKISKQEYSDGVADFQKSIELDPQNEVGYMNIGVVYMNTGNPDGAIDMFTKAIEINDTLSEAYHYRGYLEFQANNLENALSDYTRNIELSPNNANTFLDRGLIFYNLNQFEKAINDFNKAIVLKPDNAKSYYLRAQAFQDSGNKDKACEDFKKANELGVDVRNEIELNCK